MRALFFRIGAPLFAMSIFPLVFVLLLFTMCDMTAGDHGRVRNFNNMPSVPIVLPWEVCVDQLTVRELAVPTHRAMRWWQSQADRDGVPRDWFVASVVDFCEPSNLGQVYVGIAPPEIPNAVAQAAFLTNRLGDILYCDISVAPEWAWVDEDTLELWLRHEFGHCMGLAHDEQGTGSIMEAPTDPDAELTDHDFALLTAVEEG